MRKLPLRASQIRKNESLSRRIYPEGGQALLVILLIMAVALTIGLSIVSRSITDIKISELSEEGARAFSAAEAGIEEALLAGETATFRETFVETGAKYEARSEGFGEGVEFAFPVSVSRDQTQTLWFANYSDLSKNYDQGTVELFWGKPGDDAALEATIYFLDGTDYKVAKFALDPDSIRGNGFCNPPNCPGVPTFSTAGGSFGGKSFDSSATLDLSLMLGKTLLFARLRILYVDNQTLGAKGVGAALPSQGFTITSTGTAGAATRKVEVVKYHPAPPAFFDSVLYSGTDLEK